jgi:hypothetical protein
MSAIIDSTIGWDNTMHRVIAKGIDGELAAVVRDCSSLCPCRGTVLLTQSIRSRSEALTKAFLLTPRDTDVPGA